MDSKPNHEVYNWLMRMTTTRPLINYWLPDYKEKDPVEELYKNTPDVPNIWVWIVIGLTVTLLSMLLIVLIGMGKICKWKPSHGKDYNLWKLSKNGIIIIHNRIWKKRAVIDIERQCDSYEKPVVNVELNEVHVYQEGRRVTIESEEKPMLIKQTSTEQSDITPGLPFSSHNNSSSIIIHQTTPKMFEKANGMHSPHSTSPGRRNKKKISLKPACLTKTISGGGRKISPTEWQKDLEEFQARPLPPLPTSPEYLFQNDSPFKTQSIFNRSFDENRKVPLGETKPKIDFTQMERHLKNNSSQETVYLVDFTSKRKNTLSEFRKHKSTIKKKEVNIDFIMQRYRSNSLDDESLSYNSLKRQRKLMRRSRSLDNLDDNVIINTLYVDIKNYQKLPIATVKEPTQRQPYDSNRSDTRSTIIVSPRDGGIITSSSSICDIGKHESMYAKITDLPITYEKVNIQKRPMPPVPTLLDKCFLNQNPALKNHIYHRASIIDIQPVVNPAYEQVKKKVGRHLSEQFSSFRSTSSGASGQYAKIPETNNRASNFYAQA